MSSLAVAPAKLAAASTITKGAVRDERNGRDSDGPEDEQDAGVSENIASDDSDSED